MAISGAGPSMIAIVNSGRVNPWNVAIAMKKALEDIGVKAEAYVAEVSDGAELVKE